MGSSSSSNRGSIIRGSADGHHLALAAGEFAGALPALVAQGGEQFVDALGHGREIVAPEIGAHGQVLLDRERAKDIALLGHIGDAARRQMLRRHPP